MFSIDGAAIYPGIIEARADDKSKLPKVVEADFTMGDPGFARILHFRCVQPRDEWLVGPHTFTITKRDKQKAELPFQKFKVKTVTITGKKLTITDACLETNLKVQNAKKTQAFHDDEKLQSTGQPTPIFWM